MSRKKSYTNNKSLGARLKELRLSNNLTQKAFADVLGISQGFLANVEGGRYKPDGDLLIRMANIYSINLNWLLTGEGEMKKPLAKYENKEHGIDYVSDPGQVYGRGIAADYPLMKKLINEAEEAKRLGLSEEELTDLLLHVLEGELIKQRRKPLPVPELALTPPGQDTRITHLMRRIVKEDIPPEGIEERRRCMKDMISLLASQSDDTQ